LLRAQRVLDSAPEQRQVNKAVRGLTSQVCWCSFGQVCEQIHELIEGSASESLENQFAVLSSFFLSSTEGRDMRQHTL
jgi:hypothetical protein